MIVQKQTTRGVSTRTTRTIVTLAGASIVLVLYSISSKYHALASSMNREGSSTYNSMGMTNTIDPKHFKLAKDQSFGFFDDIQTHQWKLYQRIAANYQPHTHPENPLKVATHATFYQENYEPNFSCPFERRMGNNGDGGKWICDPHRLKRIAKETGSCLIYSVGSNGDFSFEVAVQRYLDDGKLCEIHIFDMGNFEREMPENLNLHYHMWGLTKGANEKIENGKLVKEVKPGQEFYSLAESVKLLGHEGRRAIDLFKIDCEGCEWTTFKDWTGPSIPRIQQILVENHRTNGNTVNFYNELMNNGYVIYHKEPNILKYCKGDCIEYAFLKLDKNFFETKH